MPQTNKSLYPDSNTLEPEPKDSDQANATLDKKFPNTMFSPVEATRKIAMYGFVGGVSQMLADTPLGKGFQRSLVDSTLDVAGNALYELGSNIDESESISKYLTSPEGVIQIATGGPTSIFGVASVVGHNERAAIIKKLAPNIPGWLQGLGFDIQKRARRTIEAAGLDPQYTNDFDKAAFALGGGIGSMGLSLLSGGELAPLYFGMIQKAQTFKEMTQTANVRNIKTGVEQQVSFMDKNIRDQFTPDIEGKYKPMDISKDGLYELTRPPMTPKEAGPYSTLAAVPEAALEWVGINMILNGLRAATKAKVINKMAGEAIAQAFERMPYDKPIQWTFLVAGEQMLQEGLQQGAEEILAKLGWNRPGTKTDIAKRVGFSALLGLVLGVPAGGFSTFALNQGLRAEMIRDHGMSEKDADDLLNQWSARIIELGETQAEIVVRELLNQEGVAFQEKTPIFVSALEQRIESRMPESASRQQVIGIIREGIKQEEIETSGIMEYLADKEKVSKKELLDHIRTNQVQIEEVMKEDSGKTRLGAPDIKTKFSSFQTPGGENYKELLLTLPSETSKEVSALQKERETKLFNTEEHKKQAELEKQTFKSPHFDEPNVLAHVRFNERIDSKGRKGGLIEEVQSDWHQAGRKRGYKTDNDYSDMSKLMSENKVPDAPFKKTWHELVLKRMLRYAVENGWEWIGWTTGEMQADRYDLSKQIDSMKWDIAADGNSIGVSVRKKGDSELTGLGAFDRNKLDNVVGKDLANKINSELESGKKGGEYSGFDIKVGGEGMKGFYDKIIPDFLNKYTKKWGGRVGQSEISTKLDSKKNVFIDLVEDGTWAVYDEADPDGMPLAEFTSEKEANKYIKNLGFEEKINSLEITDAMRKGVMEGQPLFQRGSESEAITKEEAIKQWNKLKDKIPGRYHAIFADLAKTDFHAFTDTVNRLILLTKDLKATTVPHEAFHAIFDGVLSEFERQVLRDEAFLKMGFTDQLEQDEWLAEQFANEWLGREERMKTLGGRIQQTMKDIANFLKNFIANIDNIEATYREIANDAFDRRIEEIKDQSNIRFQKKDNPLQRAIEEGNAAEIIRQLGGFKYPKHLTGEIGEGLQRKKNFGKLYRFLNVEAQGIDELLQEAKSLAPNLFDKYDTDSDLLSAILSGDIYTGKQPKKEIDYEQGYEQHYRTSGQEYRELIERAREIGVPESDIAAFERASEENRASAIESFRRRLATEEKSVEFDPSKLETESAFDALTVPKKSKQLELFEKRQSDAQSETNLEKVIPPKKSKQLELISNKKPLTLEQLLEKAKEYGLHPEAIKIYEEGSIENFRRRIEVEEEARGINEKARIPPPTVRSGIVPPEFDFGKWKDQPALLLTLDTLERNLERVAGPEADKIKQFTTEVVKHNETLRAEWLTLQRVLMRNKIRELGIKLNSTEDRLVMRYGEDRITLDELKGATKNWENVVKASEFLRGKYDEFLDVINDVREQFGYDPIPKRKDYFRHFQEFGFRIEELGMFFKQYALPTGISGITKYFRPGKPFTTTELKRGGGPFTESAIGGMDNYLNAVSKQIFHTDSVQRVRAIDSFIRLYGIEGMADLPHFVANLNEYANLLAGKTAEVNRSNETYFGRELFGAIDSLKRRSAANMIGANVSSALTNFIPFTQSFATMNKSAAMKGIFESVVTPFNENSFTIDGVRSEFFARRYPETRIEFTTLQNVEEFANTLFRMIDQFTTKAILSGKYYEGIQNGLSPEDAMHEADNYTGRIVADRSWGQVPIIQRTKGFYGLLAQFQTETANQFFNIIHDIPDKYKRDATKAAFAVIQFVIYSFLYNNLHEFFTGRRPTIDPIHALATLLGWNKTGKGRSIPNRAWVGLNELRESLPYIGGFTGGRFPIAAGLPDVGAVLTGKSGVLKEAMKPIAFYASPFGGLQVKKTIEGLYDYVRGAGFSASGKTFKYNIDQNIMNFFRAGLFGKYSFPEAQDYFAKKAFGGIKQNEEPFKPTKR